mmetsp:Transcript_27991/g.62316  ORF Transcript_27991/g.62316 Transcript_27991/m.62316 type:complete len:125 (-) Transcript_27991:15-389(-)
MLTTSRRKAKSFPVVQARVTQSAALVKQQQAGATFGVSTMNDDTAEQLKAHYHGTCLAPSAYSPKPVCNYRTRGLSRRNLPGINVMPSPWCYPAKPDPLKVPAERLLVSTVRRRSVVPSRMYGG